MSQNPAPDFSDQVASDLSGLATMDDDELMQVLNDKADGWSNLQMADLLAGLPEGPERIETQQRFAELLSSRPPLHFGATDITKMDVGVMKSD